MTVAELTQLSYAIANQNYVRGMVGNAALQME